MISVSTGLDVHRADFSVFDANQSFQIRNRLVAVSTKDFKPGFRTSPGRWPIEVLIWGESVECRVRLYIIEAV